MKSLLSAVVAAVFLSVFAPGTSVAKSDSQPPTVPTPGTVVVGTHAHGILIIVNATTLSAWAYDPASQRVTTVEVPATGSQPKPIAGAKAVLRRVCAPSPCNATYALALNGSGTATFPTSLQVGIYTLGVSIPANAVTTKLGVANKAVSMTFHLIVGREGIAMDKNVLPVVSPP
jgi:hypothetical protein